MVRTTIRARGAAVAPILLIALSLCVASGCARHEVLMPTPNLYARMEEDPFANVPEAWRDATLPVLYVTDRAEGARDAKGVHYSSGRSPRIAFGRCRIRIGDGLSWDELRHESRVAERRHELRMTMERTEELGHFPPRPRCQSPDPEGWETAEAGARRRLRWLLERELRKATRKEAYVYIHGYNNNFDSAAMTIGELWHFLGRDGLPILYSWPAGHAGALGYLADRASGEASVSNLKTFLDVLRGCDGLEKVHLIAHSRGSDVLAKALRELHIRFHAQNRDTRQELKLGDLILAAPDIDNFVIQQRLMGEDVHLIPENITLYTSGKDRAIGLSQWLHRGYHRLGGLRPETLTPVELAALATCGNVSVVVSQTGRSGWLGHSDFRDHPAVSSDVILLLRYGRRPGKEGGRPLHRHPAVPVIWTLHDGYPDE